MKILVTVGSAPHPFSRLVEAADDLAGKISGEVIIQHGFTQTVLKNAKGFDFVPYDKMTELFQSADLIISHASAGPILFAEKNHKRLILFPRSGDLGEHIDNHQIGFASALQQQGTGWKIIFDEKDLERAVEEVLKQNPGMMISHQRGHVAGEIAAYLNAAERQKNMKLKNTGWRKLKELLYFLRIYRFIASLRNHTFWELRRGYRPKDFWNFWSTHYIKEKARGTIGPSHLWLLDKLKQYPGAKILEAGCGYGSTFHFLDEKLGNSVFLYGVDISTAMLTHARTLLPKEKTERVFCGDMSSLPFSDDSFDVVFTRGALMHCPEKNLVNVLKELERVSKGEIILAEEAFWDQSSYRGKTFSLNDYTFIHDYDSLFAEAGWEVMERKLVDEGMIVLICLVCHKVKAPAGKVATQGSRGGLLR